jgi:hypothetical protein
MTISSAPILSRPYGFFAKAYSTLGVLLLLELFAQFYFIAAGVIPVAGAAGDNNNASGIIRAWKGTYDTFSALHGINGTFVIPATVLVLILLSFAARYPWKTTLFTVLLLLLLVLQFALALIGFSGLALVGGLHGLNALLLVGLALRLTLQRWAF